MDFLDPPKVAVSTRQIFIKCVNGYKGTPNKKDSVQDAKNKRRYLKKFCKAVKISARRYDSCVPGRPFQEAPITAGLSGKKPMELLRNVYSEKFSKKGEAGYEYYKKIRRSKVCGRCPICGGTCSVTHLDHYLPKSHYPTLCIHPNNLIPICDSCNTIKGEKTSTPEQGMPLHLYFDRLPQITTPFGKYTDTYLYARVDEDFQVEFFIRCPDDWDEGLTKRLEKHMEIFELYQRFSACVYAEYAQILSSWQMNMRLCLMYTAMEAGKEPEEYYRDMSEAELRQFKIGALRDVIQGTLKGACGDLNAWNYVLYQALRGKEAELAAWLEANEDRVRDAAGSFEEARRKQEEAIAEQAKAEAAEDAADQLVTA